MPEEIFVLGKKVRLLQPEGGFRTSLDSVMLAACCPAEKGDRILDLGCGVGSATFCLLQRLGTILAIGIDIQAEYIDLACKNAVLNNVDKNCRFHIEDVRAFKMNGESPLFDQVICNPPYLEAGTYTPSPDSIRAAALGHLGQERDVTDWINCAFLCLKSGGSLTLIHRADFVDKIIQSLGKRFGQIEIFPLWPHTGEKAKRVIVRAIKDRRSPCIIHPGLVLHEKDGKYTKQAEWILRDAERLF